MERQQRADFAAVLGDARDIGFFAVENHQIDEMIIRRRYALMDTALPMPMSENMWICWRGATWLHQLARTRRDHAAPDLKEFWHVGQKLQQGHEL